MTWSPGDTASTLVGGLGLIGGVIGFFRARSASKDARAAVKSATEARSDAAAALTRSASANEDAAAALKRANELTEQLLAPTPQPWVIEKGVNGWTLINKTGHVVQWIIVQSFDGAFAEPPTTWDNVEPDSQIILSAVKPFRKATVTVRWLMPGRHQPQVLPITVDSGMG